MMKRLGTAIDAGLFALLPAAVLMVPSRSWAQQGGGYYGHMWDGGWHGWFFGPVMMILLVGLIVVAAVLLIRGGDRREGPSRDSHGETPLDILEKRFARGEIDKEEFEERRRTLEN